MDSTLPCRYCGEQIVFISEDIHHFTGSLRTNKIPSSRLVNIVGRALQRLWVQFLYKPEIFSFFFSHVSSVHYCDDHSHLLQFMCNVFVSCRWTCWRECISTPPPWERLASLNYCFVPLTVVWLYLFHDSTFPFVGQHHL